MRSIRGRCALAAVFGLLAALGFAIPPLARASEIAPAGLFRDLVAPSHVRARLAYRVARCRDLRGDCRAVDRAVAVSRVQSRFPWRAWRRCWSFLRVAGGLIRRLIARLPRQRSQVARLALANLVRPGAPSTSIMVALGLGLTLLSTVALLDASVRGRSRGSAARARAELLLRRHPEGSGPSPSSRRSSSSTARAISPRRRCCADGS